MSNNSKESTSEANTDRMGWCKSLALECKKNGYSVHTLCRQHIPSFVARAGSHCHVLKTEAVGKLCNEVLKLS